MPRKAQHDAHVKAWRKPQYLKELNARPGTKERKRRWHEANRAERNRKARERTRDDPAFARAERERKLAQFKEKYKSDAEFRKRGAEAQRRRRAKPGAKELEAFRRRTIYRPKERTAVRARRMDPVRWARQNYGGVKSRAKKAGLECTYNPDILVVPDVCPVLGIPLIPCGPLNNRPSVDRFDNTRGYTDDNVRVISNRANLLKKDASVEEVKALLVYMEGRS